jgi:hypothetical protein
MLNGKKLYLCYLDEEYWRIEMEPWGSRKDRSLRVWVYHCPSPYG